MVFSTDSFEITASSGKTYKVKSEFDVYGNNTIDILRITIEGEDGLLTTTHPDFHEIEQEACYRIKA